jgi:hypothetical protein
MNYREEEEEQGGCFGEIDHRQGQREREGEGEGGGGGRCLYFLERLKNPLEAFFFSSESPTESLASAGGEG